ncbi:MAG: hypothetical protein RLZZ385_2236 [Pseudomonadota bacterium]|jgi:succinate dehydrogenase / fumarate reductase membrane anchor subunit
MVTNVSSFGRSGVYDWVIQRLSAVVLAAYTFCLMGTFVMNPDLDYQQWRDLFSHTGMRIFSLAALLALSAHAWIGMWTISTDYLTNAMLGPRGTVIRFLFQTGCALLVFVYLVWGVQILWGF